MRSIKYKLPVIFIMGLLFGMGQAAAFVNPYAGTCTLSELVLQLSGSRGKFEMGFNIVELLSFTIRILPAFIFEAYVGTELYQYFCTASVYVFSRTPNRMRWYANEVFAIAILVIIYELTLLSSTLLVTLFRYQVEFDGAGLALCACHFALYTLWTYALTVMVNLLAVLFGSSVSFMLLTGAQLVMISLLILVNVFQEDTALAALLMKLNPISHLVLGWHSSTVESLNLALHSPYNGLFLHSSLLIMVVLCGVAVLLGAFFVQRHDLLISNVETGVS